MLPKSVLLAKAATYEARKGFDEEFWKKMAEYQYSYIEMYERSLAECNRQCARICARYSVRKKRRTTAISIANDALYKALRLEAQRYAELLNS